jgi:energy-converting hydrogenase Eha subunit A
MSFLDAHRENSGNGGALVISVLGSSFVTSCLVVGYWLTFEDPYGLVRAILPLFFITFLVISVIGFVVAVVVGLPLTSVLKARRWERPWVYPASGAMAGAVAAFLIWAGPGSNNAALAGIGAFSGAICGLIWWGFHRRHFQDIEG